MADVTKELSVLIRLRGGSAFNAELAGNARAIRGLDKAAKDTNLDAALGTPIGRVEAKLRQASSAFSRWGSALTGAGKSLLPVTVAVAGIGYESGKAAATFQKNMTLLMTQANLPRKAIQGLTADIDRLTSKVGQTPNALAQAAYWPASMGMTNPSQISQVLKYAGMGASVGQDSVSNVAKAMTQVMSSGFYKDNPQGLIALMDTAIGQGHMHMDDLMSATGTSILPMLKLTGMKLPQLLATMASLTSQGVSASSAMSRMRLTFASIMSPTGTATSGARYDLSQLGLGQYALANDLRRGGLISVFQDLKTHFAEAGYSQNQQNSVLSALFGRSRGIGNAGAIEKALPRIEQILQLMSHGNVSRFSQHFRESQGTYSYQWNQLLANLERAVIPLGDEILKELVPVLKETDTILLMIVGDFQKLSPGTRKLITQFGAAAAILGPVLIVLGLFLNVISKAADGFGWLLEKLRYVIECLGVLVEIVADVIGVAAGVVVAIILLIAVVVAVVIIFRKQLWDAIKSVADFLAGVFMNVIRGAVTVFKDVVKIVGGIFTNVLRGAVTVFKDVSHVVSDVFTSVLRTAVRVFDSLIDAVKKVIDFFSHLPSAAGHVLSHAAGSLWHDATGWIPGLATGGQITGAGLTLVGEQGPELLNLPRGATVTPLPLVGGRGNGLPSLANAGFGGDGMIQVQSVVMLDGKQVGESVARHWRTKHNRK